MKTLALRAALFLLPGFAAMAAAAGDRPAGEAYHLKFQMDVDAVGKPVSLESLDSLPPSIEQKIEQWVRQRRFEPATVDGVPKPATTTLYLTLGPVPAANGSTGYAITSLFTGPRLIRGTYKYQPSSRGAGYFIVDYDQKGRVTKVEYDRAVSPKTNGSFVRWAIDLAKSFTIAPEKVNGVAVAGRSRIPIAFCNVRSACPKIERLAGTEGNDLGGEMVAKSVLKAKAPLSGDSI